LIGQRTFFLQEFRLALLGFTELLITVLQDLLKMLNLLPLLVDLRREPYGGPLPLFVGDPLPLLRKPCLLASLPLQLGAPERLLLRSVSANLKCPQLWKFCGQKER